MSDRVVHGSGSNAEPRLRWFLAAEAACLVGAAVAAWQGLAWVSLAFLAAPFQIGVLALLFRSELALLAYFVALLPLTALELVPQGYMKIVMYGIVLGLLAFVRVTAFVEVERKPNASGRFRRQLAPLAILGVSVGLAYLNAQAHGWASSYLSYYSLLAIQVVVFAWLVATIPVSIKQLQQIVYVAAAAYTVVCVAFPFVVTLDGGSLGGKTFTVGHAYVNLNSVAAHAAVFSMIVVGAALDSRKMSLRLALLTVALLLVVVLIYTKSRGAWLGFGLAYVYAIARTRSYWLLLPAGAALALLLSLDVFHGVVVGRVEATSPDDPSLLGRLLLWKYALVVFRANWLFGVGMENFRYVKHFFGYPLSLASSVRFNAHNLLLEFLADLGILGTASLLWLLGGAFVHVDRFAARSTGAGHPWLAVGLNAGLIAFAVHGLFDCILWQHGAFMLLGLLVGMCFCLQRLESASLCRQGPVAAAAGSG